MPHANPAEMFSTPRYVVKGGVLVVEEGQLRTIVRGQRLHVRPEFDSAIEPRLRRHFDRYSSVQFDNYTVGGLGDPAPPLRSEAAR